MSESPSLGIPPVLDKAGNPERQLRYRLVWLCNSIATSVAIYFFIFVDSGTIETLHGVSDFAFLAILALPLILIVIVIEGLIFFITKAIIKIKTISHVAARRWLIGPACAVTLFITLAGFWNLMPRQRLAKVCTVSPPSARDIHVVGYSSFLRGEWLGVFQVQEADFQEIVRREKLQFDPTFDFSGKLNRSYLNQTKLFQKMSTPTNPQYFKRVFSENGGRERGGIYAAFDSTTSTAIIFREYHD